MATSSRLSPSRALLSVAAAALLITAGCAHTARSIREADGYRLYTSTQDVDAAVIRFQRTAEQLCGEHYTISGLAPLGLGVLTRRADVDYTASLRCTTPG